MMTSMCRVREESRTHYCIDSNGTVWERGKITGQHLGLFF